jgi:MFS family permease
MSPFDSGIRIVPFDITFLFFGVVSGKLSDRFGHLPFTTSGLALTSVSLYLFSTVDVSTPYSLIIVYMMLLGAGIGLFVSPNMSSIMGAVPAQRRGIASALRATFFNVGFTISLNLAVLIMTFTVPYAIVTNIISSTNPILISEADRMLFVEGLKNTYLWLATLNVAAIPPSVLRKRKIKKDSLF